MYRIAETSRENRNREDEALKGGYAPIPQSGPLVLAPMNSPPQSQKSQNWAPKISIPIINIYSKLKQAVPKCQITPKNSIVLSRSLD